MCVSRVCLCVQKIYQILRYRQYHDITLFSFSGDGCLLNEFTLWT